MVHYLPDLIILWAVFTGLFLALLAYNATITRYEDNQVFLDEINAYEEQQQDQIVRKINKTMPYVRILGIISGILAVVIIAIYTWDCWQKLQGQ